MSETNQAPQVTARAKEILEDIGILQNPYLAALVDHSMSLDQFRLTQEQFFFAVTFFPRPMAVLVGRIPDPKQRLDILHNVVEEHGEFDEKAFHHTTFQDFLRTLGTTSEKLDELKGMAIGTITSSDTHNLWPALRAFNNVLTSCCLMDELEVGIACMGIIEYAFAGISAVIGKAVVENDWVSYERLVHYKLHAEIDERHAAEFFAVIEPAWETKERHYYVEQGLQLGAYVFDRLYRDMHAKVLGETGKG
ncbi:MAG: iron-containing redox enzyme family protein [Opitutales bacterium]